jgi:hypothetical protein
VAQEKELFGEIGMARVTLSDIDGHWAYDSILQLAYKGIVKGYEDNTFLPENAVTRAETTAMIARLSGRSAEFAQGKTFTDVPRIHWAYDVIMNAANGLLKEIAVD